MLPTKVESDQKAPFSIATTPRCRGGATPFPGYVHIVYDNFLHVCWCMYNRIYNIYIYNI